jgi:hypothetical protein
MILNGGAGNGGLMRTYKALDLRILSLDARVREASRAAAAASAASMQEMEARVMKWMTTQMQELEERLTKHFTTRCTTLVRAIVLQLAAWDFPGEPETLGRSACNWLWVVDGSHQQLRRVITTPLHLRENTLASIHVAERRRGGGDGGGGGGLDR